MRLNATKSLIFDIASSVQILIRFEIAFNFLPITLVKATEIKVTNVKVANVIWALILKIVTSIRINKMIRSYHIDSIAFEFFVKQPNSNNSI